MSLPLSGIRVVDLTQYIAGPYATMLMADAGATVIKVESPAGDDTRRIGPWVPAADGDVSAFHLRMNRGKQSVVLDLKSDDGRAALASLIAGADVLVENYRAGVLERLGFGADRLNRLNPGLVYCSISGFGHTPSPDRDRPAYNTVAEFESGIYAPPHPRVPGDLPGSIGLPVGDMVPALHALAGLSMALLQRARTGAGSHVDISMFDSMLSLNELRSSTAISTDTDAVPDGRDYFCPYGVYPTRDGHLFLDVTTDRQWRGFCATIGRPDLADDPGLATGPDRSARYDDVIGEPLETWLAARGRDEACAAFLAHGVPVAVLRSPAEALLSAQSAARGMPLLVDDGHGAQVTVPASPIRVRPSTAPHDPMPRPHTAARLGRDTREVLCAFTDLDPSTIDRLCSAQADL
ncbi:CaiB/BaiF CoA transferase family protein [Gordonia sp. (in: high G+C Gram-positive bacteria)]|uniref:CaiB/BaiF CoA transferase family protein n=1 Tax=Gordonia sp. (in: high G+C Gram-positive bacteria) TaxID=84139 RepID=UPI003C77F20A